MESKRKIKAKRFLRDFRKGMPNDQLMEKYHVSSEELRSVFGRLLAAGVLDEDELKVNLPESIIEDLIHSFRNVRRCYTTFFVPVYDLDDLRVKGQLNDISEAGLSVSGIKALPGMEKKLVVQADHLAEIYPFCIEAVCRWSRVEPDGNTFCGFEVPSWPPEARDALPKLIRSLTMCDQP